MPSDWSSNSRTTTIWYACTVRSVTSPRWTSWLVAPMRSGQREDKSWRPRTPGAEPRRRRRKLPEQGAPRYIEGTWAEDRATRGRDPSADPGAETGEGGTTPPHGLPGLAQ